MPNSQVEFASVFGWAGFFENQQPVSNFLIPARVINEERGLFRVQWSLADSGWATLSGKRQYEAVTRVDYPAVGDWVWIEISDGSDRAIIHQIADRKTMIVRKQVGPVSDVQILSTNVDTMLIATSVNDDLNFRRLDRYMSVARESGVTPVILLTKSDLRPTEMTELIESVRKEFVGVEIHALSREDFTSATFLPSYLKPGTTTVIVGSSGVGKSTLVNYLIGENRERTQDIRESDQRGKHTTTARSLYVSRFGGLIIDTPGMRELQMSSHGDGVSQQFSDIESLIQRCRFTDCRHDSEPGCEIKAAIESGDLAKERWLSYRKLAAEARFEERKQNKALASEEKKIWKKRSVMAKQHRRN